MINMSLLGTLIAAFLTKNAIFFASDGRVIDSNSGKVHNNWSKVHRINNYVGMLTDGAYLKHLKDDIVRNCNEKDSSSADGVAQIASLLLKEIWHLNFNRIEREGKLNEVRIFIFLAGFDNTKRPRLFYMDNMSDPIFKIQERQLFQSGRDLEIAAMSTGSGQNENPSELLTSEIKKSLQSLSGDYNLSQVLYSSFGATKDQLSVTNSQIGGETFFSKIDISNGYQDLSNEMVARDA